MARLRNGPKRPVLELGSDHSTPLKLDEITEALLKSSRKSFKGFFKSDELPRRAKVRPRGPSVTCSSPVILNAPATTPDAESLTPIMSLHSSNSTTVGTKMPSLTNSAASLTETCTTSPTEEGQPPNDKEHVPSDVHEQKPEVGKTSGNPSSVPEQTELQTDLTGLNVNQIRQWGLKMLHDIQTPLRRRKIRRGKQKKCTDDEPSSQAKSTTQPRPIHTSELLAYAFTQPGCSKEFETMKLHGGKGPPPYLSQKTLDKLDELEREEKRLKQELSQLSKDKRIFLKRAEERDRDELLADRTEKQTEVEASVLRKDTQEDKHLLKLLWMKTTKTKIFTI